jgi:hypothetical protein
MALAAGLNFAGAAAREWRASAERSLNALLARAGWADNFLVISEGAAAGRVWGKLGTVALLAVALSQSSMCSDIHADTLTQLLRTVASAQQLDGTFRCCIGRDDEQQVGQEFYPGQALLALAANTARDTSAIDRCLRAFWPYRAHFRAKPNTGFVLWHVDAWSRLALLTRDGHVIEFVFELVDWILQFQHGRNSHELFRGGFRDTPGVSSCVFGEAVVRALALAHAVGDRARVERYRVAVIAALSFCSRLRIGPDQRPFLPDPDRADGGVTTNLSTLMVRCDHVQHLMTFAAAALDVAGVLFS